MQQPDQRLVRRYNPIGRVEITFAAEEPPTPDTDPRPRAVHATVLDVSVTGMLVGLPSEQKAEPGDIVTLSWEDHDAVARVAHTARVEEPAQPQLVGVEITEMSPEFTTNLYTVVAALRGDHGQLAEQWHRQW